ncbi:nitrogen assimilation transcription factor nit-4 [Fusarium beomiforme]|uniref:Nitrogen assimilation transcription factor nit-4 n=1 Tax=Fusarium beomiforme TaxID=44412 RepID=A0A9P5E1E2_9HYPO|nr:nitrogen assimilation transcription factor nit-4 [Fusarium beomiforme]
MGESTASGSRPRQRVSVACLPCRRKRIKCDGAQPTCGSCLAKGESCEYIFTENKRKPPSKTYVQALEARIKSLEEQLSSRDKASVPECSSLNQDIGMSMSFDYTDDSEGLNPVSALAGLMGRFSICDNDGQLHYFGSQSNYHLTSTTLNSISIESTVSLQQQGLFAAERLGKSAPLSMELQDHLLELYWTWQNTGIYIIHKKAFLRAFKSRTYGKYCTPLLLSAIFAIASRFSDRAELRSDPEDTRTAGAAFFEQAKILFLYESQAAVVATVQAAALMSMRALSDGQEALGWLYCGNTARMAFNLGLNIDCSDNVVSGLVGDEEAEVRKVTWWGCFILEKLYSISVGRPSCTRQTQITCRKPSLDHDVEFEPWNPKVGGAAIPSRLVSTGHYAVKFLSIASEAMDQM